jgi:hypothetical protein
MKDNKSLEILDADNIDFCANLSDGADSENESVKKDTDIVEKMRLRNYKDVDQDVRHQDVMHQDVSGKDTTNETQNKKEQNSIEPNEIASDDDPGVFYNLIHILDDIYVYGRTVIENNYFNLSDNADFNLVYPNIYIGNYSTSTNLELLSGLGITHILSVIPTFNPPFPEKFTYLHIPAYDDDSQNMVPWFEKTNPFIQDVLNQRGKLLLHCMVGRSRSVCIFIAFLIHILQGRFNQSLVDTTSDGDVSNEIEYNNFGLKAKNNRNNPDGLGVRYLKKEKQARNQIKSSESIEEDNDISRTEYIKPQLSNKYKTFMIYKKQTMISEIEELIEKYNGKESKSSTNSRKEMFNDLLAYAVKYRPIACPNERFRYQLMSLL